MLATLFAIPAVITAVMWVLCKARALPPKVMRIWFCVVLVVAVLAMTFWSVLFDSLRYLGVPFSTTSWLNCIVCNWTFWACCFFNPHINIEIDESKQKWSKIPNHSVVALNHTSFWDTFVFVGRSPFSYIHNCRTLMKSSLKKIPLFGGIFDRVGQFPVYFKSDEDGNFSVDKERQAPVMERVKEHLKRQGRLALFPEGVVNKEPRTLRSFRLGTFATVIENRLPVYYFLAVGNQDTWPATAAVGGLPADIYCSIHHYPIDFDQPGMDAKQIAEGLQADMQRNLDALYAKKDKKKN